MNQPIQNLDVYKTGETTIVGFRGREVLDQIDFAACRDELMDLAARYDSKTMGFDLKGVKLIPSGLLGVLASLHRQGIGISIYNPSRDILEVLEITKLNQVFRVEEVDS